MAFADNLTSIESNKHMHENLEQYLNDMRKEKEGYEYPNFCSEYSNQIENKEILVILQDPGNSSPETKTGECSILNPDPTAKKIRETLSNVKIDYNKVLLWNFFPFFGFKGTKILDEDKDFWASKIEDLLNLLPNVKVLVVCGKEAWDGMRFFKNENEISFISAPHPSLRGMLSENAHIRFESAWKLAIQKVSIRKKPSEQKINELLQETNYLQAELVKYRKKFNSVTGRDTQIICEALSIAIPLMLRHSLACNNSDDMIKILKTYGCRKEIHRLNGNELTKLIIGVVKELKEGKRHEGSLKSCAFESLVTDYLSDISDRELNLPWIS